jgi:pyruvate dehydrogenase E1 component alpha subunit
VEAVFAGAERIISAAREGRPGFIELNCFRFFGHARMDKSPYRGEAEEIEGRKRDPISGARGRLVERKTASPAELDAYDEATAKEMDAAVEAAIAAKPPGLAAMFDHVFADGEPKPRPVRDSLRHILNEAR